MGAHSSSSTLRAHHMARGGDALQGCVQGQSSAALLGGLQGVLPGQSSTRGARLSAVGRRRPWVGVPAQACLQVLLPRRLPTRPSVYLCALCPCWRTGRLRRGSGAPRISTVESLPFLWHRRQHGQPEGADSVGSDNGVRLASSCCFETVALASAVFFLVRCSRRVTWSELGFFWLLGGERGAGESRLLSGGTSY